MDRFWNDASKRRYTDHAAFFACSFVGLLRRSVLRCLCNGVMSTEMTLRICSAHRFFERRCESRARGRYRGPSTTGEQPPYDGLRRPHRIVAHSARCGTFSLVGDHRLHQHHRIPG